MTTKSIKTFQFLGTSFRKYPIDPVFGMIWFSEYDGIGLPKQSPICEEWGASSVLQFPLEDEYDTPRILDTVYLSVVEKKFYSLECELPYKNIESLQNEIDKNGEFRYNSIILGLAPYGSVALWISGNSKETLLGWYKGEEINISMEEYSPHDLTKSLDECCDSFINADSIVKNNFIKNGLPPKNLFDKYMQQFTYRYMLLFEKWNDGEEAKWQKYREDELKPRFEYIEESLFDGTFDKLHDDGLQKYHEAGKPKKLRVEWHIGKSEYSAYFWFEDERIREVFDRFYGAHPDTKTDFIIRIDAEKRKYELALYRYGLKEPQVIPEDVYQLLVFKNKFEDYRSDNYNQERGAWIW